LQYNYLLKDMQLFFNVRLIAMICTKFITVNHKNHLITVQTKTRQKPDKNQTKTKQTFRKI